MHYNACAFRKYLNKQKSTYPTLFLQNIHVFLCRSDLMELQINAFAFRKASTW